PMKIMPSRVVGGPKPPTARKWLPPPPRIRRRLSATPRLNPSRKEPPRPRSRKSNRIRLSAQDVRAAGALPTEGFQSRHLVHGEFHMNIISLIISLVSGAVGGNLAGAAMKDKSLGVTGNSLSGILGGGIGGAILQLLGIGGAQGAMPDIASILENIASGGI